jgi:uncharacterized membrane protein
MMNFTYLWIGIVFGIAVLLWFAAMFWNAKPWQRELDETRRANRDGQRIIERLEQVAR